MHAHNNHKLINAYEKKTTVVRYFENVLMQQRKGVMDLKSFTFWNAQLIPWITLLAIGFYIGASAKMVLGGRISLGALVTTINVYKDLGDRFSTILDGLKALSKAISPLSGLTIQFNLETDIPALLGLTMKISIGFIFLIYSYIDILISYIYIYVYHIHII
ncbi:unnamed protein product [Cladocopium goreaui]|uniref:Uncharacterized protein n=1 Tax=Cladocopium goreaui TaxID=2562237 RepID=A0A9P1CPV6_9DINO|nr:unnamed protein product [Cladocopium goreaui]